MSRFLLSAVLGLLVGGVVWADIAPPPPAAGFKRLSVENKLGFAQEFSEYTFVLVAVGPGPGSYPTGVKQSTKELIAVKPGRYGTRLVAVAKDASKAYATEKEFLDAVATKKVTGALSKDLGTRTTLDVKQDDPRTKVVTEFIVEKIDPKEGIILREPKKKEKGAGETADDEGLDNSEPIVGSPRGGVWIAGGAAFLGLALAGLWLVRRFGGASQTD